MQAFWHWLTALGEVYARHAERHGPNRLLPAEVLPPHGRVPEPAEPSPQGSGSDGRTAESSTPKSAHDTDRRDEGACADSCQCRTGGLSRTQKQL
jgi:hypothetical protein